MQKTQKLLYSKFNLTIFVSYFNDYPQNIL